MSRAGVEVWAGAQDNLMLIQILEAVEINPLTWIKII
jgi:hypothetical protein